MSLTTYWGYSLLVMIVADLVVYFVTPIAERLRDVTYKTGAKVLPRGAARRHTARMRVALVLLFALLMISAAAFLAPDDQIYGHIRFGGTSIVVDAETRRAAAAQLRWFSVRQRFRTNTLLVPGHAPIEVPAYALGYIVDGTLSAWRAYSIGRRGSPWRRFSEQMELRFLNGQTTVPVAQRVNQRILHRFLLRLAAHLDRAAHPGVQGRQLEVAKAQRQLTHLLLGRGVFRVRLPFTALPALPLHHRHHHHTSRSAATS